MMKKLLSLVLALAMSLTMCITAFADETEEDKTTISGIVTNNTSDYTMTVPVGKTDLDLTNTSSSQNIGDLKITLTSADKTSGTTFATGEKVTVTISSANSGKLKNSDSSITTDNTLAYTLGIGSTSVTDWTTAPTQDFSASDIDNGTPVALTATVTGDATTVKNGTYQDVLTFTAQGKVTFSFWSLPNPEYHTVDKGTTWAQWVAENPTFWGTTVSVDNEGYVSVVFSDGGRDWVMDRNANKAKQKGTDVIQAHQYAIAC